VSKILVIGAAGLIGAGVVAYAVNHALKPAGWSVPAEKPQPAA